MGTPLSGMGSLTVKQSELKARKKKLNCNTQDLIRMITYGMADPLTKPDFVKFTTIKEI